MHEPPINANIVTGYESGFKFIFLLPGNGKDYENEYLHKKNLYNSKSVPLCLLHVSQAC